MQTPKQQTSSVEGKRSTLTAAEVPFCTCSLSLITPDQYPSLVLIRLPHDWAPFFQGLGCSIGVSVFTLLAGPTADGMSLTRPWRKLSCNYGGDQGLVVRSVHTVLSLS